MGEAGRKGRGGLWDEERSTLRVEEEEEPLTGLWHGATGVEGTRPGEFGQQPRDPAVLENLITQERAQFKALMDNLLNENAIVKADYDKARNAALGAATDEETSKRLWRGEKQLWAKEKASLETKIKEMKEFHNSQMQLEQEKSSELAHELRSRLDILERAAKEKEEIWKELSRAHQTSVDALKGQLEATMRRLNGLLSAKTVSAGTKALAESQTGAHDQPPGKEIRAEAKDGPAKKEKKDAKKAAKNKHDAEGKE